MIRGGYYIKARKIEQSAVAHCNPCIREIWDFFLRRAAHKDSDKFKRGELFTTYSEISESLSWKKGWQKMAYSKHEIEWALKAMRSATLIATHKSTRGMRITVVKYDYYQDPSNYGDAGTPHGTPRRTPHYKQEGKEIIISPDGDQTMKKHKMGSYREDAPSDSYEEVVDMDTGEAQEVVEVNYAKEYRSLLDWAEKRRGSKFINVKKQYKAMAGMRDAKIGPQRIKNRWCEMELDPFWKEKGFDFMSILTSFDKKA